MENEFILLSQVRFIFSLFFFCKDTIQHFITSIMIRLDFRIIFNERNTYCKYYTV